MTSGESTPGARRPTLEMVAARAGVSRGTASRALNGGVGVSPKAMAAVAQAVQSLGYQPTLAARSLAVGRSESIGLVVSEADDRLFNDPFFARLVSGVRSALVPTDTQLVITLAHTVAEQEQVVRMAAGRHVDGVLLVSLHGKSPLPRALAKAGVPVVAVGRPVETAHGADDPWWVDADNRGGARQATRFLCDSGRRRVATIAGPQDMAAGQDRLNGWRDVVPEADWEVLAEPGDFTRESGFAAMNRLIDRVRDLDAVFVGNDPMALGALDALARAGRRVPDDVAVVGFDNALAAQQSLPTLSTVEQPVGRLGTLMTEMLLARVLGRPVQSHHVVLPTRLVLRESS